MAGSATRSFTSPGGAPPKMKSGKILPKVKKKVGGQPADVPVDPLRLASSSIPNFKTRHAATNGKTGFHTKPARPPSGHMTRAGKVNRGSGKEHRALL